MKPKYQHIILGGTFDHLHIGHKSLLVKAFGLANKVTIGICRENLYQNKFLPSAIEDYKTRKRNLIKFLKDRGSLDRAVIVPIIDIYGNSGLERDIDAIIVTEKTYPNALKINRLRKNIGFKPLEIVTVPLIKAGDGQVVTSERIRRGEIDRNGYPYFRAFKRERLFLPDNLRDKLRQPAGLLIAGSQAKQKDIVQKVVQLIDKLKPTMVTTVGDVISLALVEGGFVPDVKIIDFKTQRKKICKSSWPTVDKGKKKYVNEPGTLNKEAVGAVDRAVKVFLKSKKKQLIVIEGEEDLLALPAILLSPLKSLVIYGQFPLGVVMVEVTEERKKKALDYVNRFTVAEPV